MDLKDWQLRTLVQEFKVDFSLLITEGEIVHNIEHGLPDFKASEENLDEWDKLDIYVELLKELLKKRPLPF